jgi:hypothetical protein
MVQGSISASAKSAAVARSSLVAPGFRLKPYQISAQEMQDISTSLGDRAAILRKADGERPEAA